MIESGCDIDHFIEVRKSVHQEAEGGFKEFKTLQKMITELKAIGIKQSDMKKCAKTGMYVDIKGTG